MRPHRYSFVLVLLVSILCASLALADVRLVVSDTATATLYELDPGSGQTTSIGGFGTATFMAGLAYDPDAEILYGSTSSGGKLYRIDPATGAATEIGETGFPIMHGLAFDTASGDLYASFGVDLENNLYRIDPATAAATLVGAIGFFTINHRDTIGGLAFHPQTQVLYGCMSGPSGEGALVTIDTSTGQGTRIGFTQALNGLAFHPQTHVLYAVNNGSSQTPEALWTVNLDTAAVSQIGLVSLGNPLGLSFIGSGGTAAEATSWGSLKARF